MNSIADLEGKLDQLLREPCNFQLLNGIGVLLYQMKDWDNAGMYFQRAYELNPEDRDILYNYASLLHLQSQWDKAILVYEAYLGLEPGDRAVMEKTGDAYYQLGEYELAAKKYEQLRKG